MTTRFDNALGVIFGLAAALIVLTLSSARTHATVEQNAALELAYAEATSAASAYARGGSSVVTVAHETAASTSRLRIATLPDRQLVGAWPGTEGSRPLTVAEKGLFDRAERMAAQGRSRLDATAPDRSVRVSAMLPAGSPPGIAEVELQTPAGGNARLWTFLLITSALAASFIASRMPAIVGTQASRQSALFSIGATAVGGFLAGFASLSRLGHWQTEKAADVETGLEGLASAYNVTLERTNIISEPLAGARFDVWLAVFLAAAIAAFFAFGIGRRIWETLKTHRTAYAYAAPAVIGALVLVFFPFLYGVAISFTDTTLVNQTDPFVERWTGISNYLSILGDTDLFRRGEAGLSINYQSFWWTLFVTILWTVTNVTLGVSIGLGLALLLNTPGLAGRGIYRVLLILPWAVPNYITALVWKGMFHPQFGVINQGVQLFGFQPVSWFDSFGSAFLTGLAANVWLSFPFMMVVSLGALQSVSKDMYEAARLEGASAWRRFVDITLPSVQPALVPAVILSVVWTFNMFNVIYLVSNGEPAGANEILITEAYKIGFEQYRYGYSAAYSVVIFAILLAYGVFQVRATRATEQV
ncbi:MAG: sugar ABC transporter permease [Pseudomonadota bacterium]